MMIQFYSSLFPLILVINISTALIGQAQTRAFKDINAIRWILESDLNETEIRIPVSTHRRIPPMTASKELGLAGPEDLMMAHIVNNSWGTFLAVEGTGRIYRVNRDDFDGVKFQRLDSSEFGGYNYGALVFSFRDTIYSLGGYGFWNNNGLLRRFDQRRHGWEIIPTNRHVQVRYLNLGYFVDYERNSLWFVNTFSKHEGLKPGLVTTDLKEEGMVFRLDLESKDWHVEGRMTPEFSKLFHEYQIFAQTPWGSLIYGGFQEKHFYLVSYFTNQLLEYTDMNRGREIGNLTVGREISDGHGRPYFWFKRDSLHVFTTGVGHSSYFLSLGQFRETGITIYSPEMGSLFPKLPDGWVAIFLLGIGAVLGMAVGYRFFRRRQTEQLLEEPEYFGAQERKILLALEAASGFTLSVEEMDTLLGTELKSKDRQNQVRSAVTRSINRAYQALTGDPENLIETRRQEFDRRMIRYELNQTKFAAVRDQVRQEE